MSLHAVLSGIVQGTNDFCSLCFQAVNDNAVWMNDTVYCSSKETYTLSDLIGLTLGEEFVAMASVFGVFCEECKISLVNNYKFNTMCRENIDKITTAVDSLSESFTNVLPNLDHYNTMFVSLDLHDFTNKQFYDMAVFNTADALKLLNGTSTKEEPKNFKTFSLSKLNDGDREKIRKHTVVYNVPSVPTGQIVIDAANITNFTCKVCHKSFTEEHKLRCHFFKKHYPRKVKCLNCPRKFISKAMLKQHEEVHHKPGICSRCGKSFKSLYLLEKHLNNHGLRITCHNCGRVYRSMEAFKKHISDDVCSQKSKKSADQAIHQCDYCNKRYCYKHYLSKHIMYEHGNAEGFRCEYCNKQFYTQSRLKTHILKHTREKNFKCNTCGGKFATRESLIYHTRLHTGEKPYQCEHCTEAFVSASRRLDHMRRHHLAPSLECDICHVKFKATGSLLKHKKRHLNPNSRLFIIENKKL